MPDWTFLMLIGIALIIIGFFLIASGVMQSAGEGTTEKSKGEAKVKGGGVILIGPLPVIFGTDKRYALHLLILAIVLMVLSIIFLK